MRRQSDNKTIIVVTGPESCGKTHLSSCLADEFNAVWIPEYAREYVEKLNRPYTIDDVERIARKQIEQYEDALQSKQPLVFIDTFLIITKVWLTYVYGQCPVWLHRYIKKATVDLCLLCKPDIEWVPDGVRENSDIREELYQIYKSELEYYGWDYREVKGQGQERFNMAKEHVKTIINQKVRLCRRVIKASH